MSTDPAKTNADRAKPGTHPSPTFSADSDAILRTIGEMEQQLGGLRWAREETQRLERDLDRRREAIESAESKLAARSEELELGRAGLAEKTKELQERDRRVAAERKQIEARAAELEARAQEIDQQQRGVADQLRLIENDRKELDARANRVDLKNGEIDKRAAALAAERQEVDGRAASLKLQQEQLAAEAKEIESQKRDLDSRRAAVEAKEKQVADLEASIQSRDAQLSQMTAAIEAQRAELDARSASMASTHAELQARAAELDQVQARIEAKRLEAEAARNESQEMLKQAEARNAELDKARAAMDARQADADREREHVAAQRRQAESLRRQAEELRAESSQQAERRSLELKQQAEELEAREERMRQVERLAAESVLEASRKRDEAIAGAQRAAERLTAVERELDGLRSGATSASEVASTALDRAREDSEASAGRANAAIARAEQLEAQAADLREQVKQLTEDLSTRLAEAAQVRTTLEARIISLEDEAVQAATTLADTLAKLEQASAVSPEDIQKRDMAIEALSKQLDEAREWGKMLEAELASKPESPTDASEPAGGVTRNDAAPAPSVPAALSADAQWVALRRVRLAKYKSLLQVQARKILTAKEALAKRRAECDTVLAQRVKLAEAVEAIRARERHLAAKRAGVGAAAIVFYSIGIAALLGMVSWAVTNQIVPATYIATAILSADTQGREAGEGELAGWQQYHEGLLVDPKMINTAAERYGKRGMATLAVPQELAARLKQDLALQTKGDGVLVLELKGKGTERTARELDTFVTAVAAVANASRSGRPDGLATTIAQSAKVGHEPVEDPRLTYALGFAGGGMLAAGLLGVMIWSRLSRSKSQYEEDQRIGEAMGGLSWEGVPTAPHRPAPQPPAAR
ncbi:MAG: hypothetical protein KF745_14365 [Phycisphaeraceae bacterium]|nr:hypothetical protein [Phycisphaeraceae bacterium]